ncbi:DegV family protein [Alkalicoccobacillus murimartini]|uniref:DegV family protein with EDD domain n=1 Tax=Alkalicoccobacillus murimartini TaxID=171685 RepID=A0ABT9YH80_9BACI|nr:DegV family protein [Alkalicoccobacillus murimartini]MDQ0206399.1 DegV family protein with EDD domain [Alkalicoccobacillus murimartini]
MPTIRIVTDSTADIPKEIVEKWNIEVIPLSVVFSETESYEDGVTLTPEAFYEKIEKEDVIPTTSQPTPHQFEEVYRALKSEGAEVIFSIHLSSKLSGTYQAATIAQASLEDEVDVRVVDSRQASYAIGIMVAEMAELAYENKPVADLEARLDELTKDTNVYFLVDTLHFLQKNGRIGKASAILGSLLKVKPILSLSEEGEVYPLDKARGPKKAISRIVEIIKEQYGDSPIHIGASHALNEELANELVQRVKQECQVESVVMTTIGAVIGAHVGPGTVSISCTKATTK